MKAVLNDAIICKATVHVGGVKWFTVKNDTILKSQNLGPLIGNLKILSLKFQGFFTLESQSLAIFG